MSWISLEILSRGGAISFRDFMELALYSPAHGYYAQPTPRYGRGGDYLTAPTASRWYSVCLARLLSRLSFELGRLTLVDIGSGDGTLLTRLLEELADGADRVLRAVVSVERSGALRSLQTRRPSDPLQVKVLAELGPGELPDGPVVLHASELFDAIPVHRVVGRVEGLQELWVAAGGGELSWVERPAGQELVDYFAEHGVRVAEGQLAEACLETRPLHHSLLSSADGPALALVLDYGYEARRLYDPRARRRGSLACYRAHRLGRDPLVEPGEQDITAHVNWDDLRLAAREASWEEVGLWPLAELLLRTGLAAELSRRGLGMEAELSAGVYAERQEVKRLLDPDGMGADLKVLVQGRGAAVAAAARALRQPV